MPVGMGGLRIWPWGGPPCTPDCMAGLCMGGIAPGGGVGVRMGAGGGGAPPGTRVVRPTGCPIGGCPIGGCPIGLCPIGGAMGGGPIGVGPI